jgi:site-specific recombinase XerD
MQRAWLAPHRLKFLKALATKGYSTATQRMYGVATVQFCQEVDRRRVTEGQLAGSVMTMVLEATFAAMHPNRQGQKRYCVQRFIEVLVEAGVAEMPKPRKMAPTPLDRLKLEYRAYLRDQRGLTDGTIDDCVSFLVRFMTFRFDGKVGDLDAITPHDVVAFMSKLRDGTAPRDKTPPSHLRNLFRFLFWSGKTKRDISASIPRVRQPARSTLPRHLAAEQVEKLLDATWAATPVGRRNYAMLLVLARLGLRSPEVIAIQLDDIDWRNGTILVRGKGKRQDRMPLPDDVGKAIVDYIKNGRRGMSRTLFVSHTPPHSPFVDATILNTALKQAFEETGIEPPQKFVGAHLLRHSLATDMLRKGASLDEIGDVLRHRSRMSTTIYARHDIDGLRSLAPAWPKEKAGTRNGKEVRA